MTFPPEINEIDFSEAHFLDHPLWRCRDQPGGWRRHLVYRWRYQWSEILWRHTFCRVGRHYYTNVFTRRHGRTIRLRRCFYCWQPPKDKAVLHGWNNGEWTCTQCGYVSPDPCDCRCCRERTGP